MNNQTAKADNWHCACNLAFLCEFDKVERETRKMKIFKKAVGIIVLSIIYGGTGLLLIAYIVSSVRQGESLLWSILKLPK